MHDQCRTAAGRPRKLSSLTTDIEQLNALWQLQQWSVPTLTMETMPPLIVKLRPQ